MHVHIVPVNVAHVIARGAASPQTTSLYCWVLFLLLLSDRKRDGESMPVDVPVVDETITRACAESELSQKLGIGWFGRWWWRRYPPGLRAEISRTTCLGVQ
jgi:hypothetical protein